MFKTTTLSGREERYKIERSNMLHWLPPLALVYIMTEVVFNNTDLALINFAEHLFIWQKTMLRESREKKKK